MRQSRQQTTSAYRNKPVPAGVEERVHAVQVRINYDAFNPGDARVQFTTARYLVNSETGEQMADMGRGLSVAAPVASYRETVIGAPGLTGPTGNDLSAMTGGDVEILLGRFFEALYDAQAQSMDAQEVVE